MVKEHYLYKSLEYNELVKENELLEYELDVLSKKIRDEGIVLSEFKAKLRLELQSLGHGKLKEYAYTIEKIEKNVSISKEIEEAITEGVLLNKRINSVITFLSHEANQKYFSKNNQIIEILNIPRGKIDTYQKLIIKTRHALLKFEVEINDVYRQVFDEDNPSRTLGSDLLQEYKTSLMTDFKLQTSLFNSLELIRTLKSNVMGLTQSLRKDLKSLRQELQKLESKEMELRKML